MRMSVPLHLAIERTGHYDDDRLEHLLCLGVVGMNDPLTVAIESDFYEWPRIKEVWGHGGIDLPTRLQDLFVFKCFTAMAALLSGSDSDLVEETIPDATFWVETQFLTDEAEVLLTELRRHVTPDLVVDPFRYARFTHLPHPF